MAYILGEPTVQQYFDANGDPLAGGTIEFYLSGTSTATPVYSDDSGTSLGTSVTLNSIGAPQSSGGTAVALFFDTSVAYKIVRKDSGGSAIAPTIDPYYPLGNGIEAEYDSFAEAYAATNTGINIVKTRSFLGGWAGTTAGPKGSAEYHRDGTTGTASTAYSDKNGFYDANGDGFRLAADLPRVNLLMFGADGSTGDYEALRCAAAYGGVIEVPPAAFTFASASISSISLSAGTVLMGTPGQSKFTITGSTEINKFLHALNVSDVLVYGIEFVGNSTSASAGNGGAIQFEMNGSATGHCENLHVRHCKFSNFKQDFWVYALNNSTTYEMRNVSVEWSKWTSLTGNDRDNTSIGVPACMVGIRGNVSNSTGLIKHVSVAHNEADGTYIKSFVNFWSCVQHFSANHNLLTNFGSDGNDDTATYAILTYSDRFNTGTPGVAYNPQHFHHYNNVIDGVRDAGHYCQGAMYGRIDDIVDGQTSTAHSTIPKGAIALNGCHEVEIGDGCILGGTTANAIDIAVGLSITATIPLDSTVHLNSPKCLSGGSFPVRISPNTDSASYVARLNINSPEVDGGPIYFNNSITSDKTHIKISGGHVINAANGIQSAGTAPSSPGDYVIDIDGVTLHDITQDAILHASVSDVVYRVRRCNMDMGTIGRYGINIASSDAVEADYNHFWASATPGAGDYCMNTTSAEYTRVGNTFRGIPSANMETGFSAPSWTATEGAYVQSFDLTEAGSAASKYVIYGYVYESGGSWVDDRRLTGN